MLNYSRTILILIISLSAAMMGVPTTAHADASNPTSTLSIGDWWKYNVQTPVGGLLLTGSQTITIVFQANTTATEWTGRSSASGTLTGKVNGMPVTGTWVQGGWSHMRKTDLADADSRFTLNITIVGLATFTTYFTFISTNNPPVLQYQFPLTVGASWAMSGGNDTIYSSYYYSFDPTVHTNTNKTSTNAVYNVLASSLTSVNAGTFDTYQIRETSPDRSYVDTYYSPEIENIVQQLGFAANGTQESYMILTDNGAWPYKSTIGLSISGTNHIAVIGTDVSPTLVRQEGEAIIFTVSGTDTVTCKVSLWIPVLANNTLFKVLVDAKAIAYTASSNTTFYQILFSFPLSTHTVTITYIAPPSLLDQYLIPIIIGIAAVAAAVILLTILVVRRRGREAEPVPFWQPPSTPPQPAPPAESPPPPPPAETPPP